MFEVANLKAKDSQSNVIDGSYGDPFESPAPGLSNWDPLSGDEITVKISNRR